jgi:hypothetical protein
LVAARYVKKPVPKEALVLIKEEDYQAYLRQARAGGQVRLRLFAGPRSRAFVFQGGKAYEVKVADDGLIEINWRASEADSTIMVAVHFTNGATSLSRFPALR